jgi:hypothetical protein
MPVYKGWNAKIYISGQEVGYVDEVTVDIDHNLETYFAAGNRQAVTTIEGPIDITGSFSRAWINKTYLSLLTTTGTLSTFTLQVQVGGMTLTLNNCKLKKGSISVPQDGVLKEDYDFTALSFSIS